MLPLLLATGTTLSPQLDVRYDPAKPRELANTREPTCESKDAPSEFSMRGSAASAVSSALRACSIFQSVSRFATASS